MKDILETLPVVLNLLFVLLLNFLFALLMLVFTSAGIVFASLGLYHGDAVQFVVGLLGVVLAQKASEKL